MVSSTSFRKRGARGYGEERDLGFGLESGLMRERRFLDIVAKQTDAGKRNNSYFRDCY